MSASSSCTHILSSTCRDGTARYSPEAAGGERESTPSSFALRKEKHRDKCASGNAAAMRDYRIKAAIRRYYVLSELVETERSYLKDLRVLVEIYLTSIGAIVHRSSRAYSGNQDGVNDAGPSSRPSCNYHQPSYLYPPSSFPAYVFGQSRDIEVKGRVATTGFTSHSQRSSLDESSRKSARSATDFSSGLGQMPTRPFSSQLYSVQSSAKMNGISSQTHGHSRECNVDQVQMYPSCDASAAYPEASTAEAVSTGYNHAPKSSESTTCLKPSPFQSTSASDSYYKATNGLPGLPLSQALVDSLSDAEKRVLARGASELVHLHERIVERIESALWHSTSKSAHDYGRYRKEWSPLKALSGVSESEVEEAVRAVCKVFADEASNFSPYEAFCVGHSEALDTAHRCMRLHANEWTEWERHCAEEAAHFVCDPDSSNGRFLQSPRVLPDMRRSMSRSASRFSLAANNDIAGIPDLEETRSTTSASTSTLRRARSASGDTGGSLRASGSFGMNMPLKHTKSDPTSSSSTNSLKRHTSNGAFDSWNMGCSISSNDLEKERKARMKLKFEDYLIKPVQRVCKYPLLFEQLRIPEEREDTQSTNEFSKVSGSLARSDVMIGRLPLDGEDVPRSTLNRNTETQSLQWSRRTNFSLGNSSDEDEEDASTDVPERRRRDFGNRVLHRSADEEVEHALQAMRSVAHSVDDARRRQDLEHKSRLIVERLIIGTPNAHDPLPTAPAATLNVSLPTPLSTTFDYTSNTIAGADMQMRNDNGNIEDAVARSALETLSEVGHGSNIGDVKPPTRSYSFSSAFARPRSHSTFGRTAALVAQQRLQNLDGGQRQDPSGPNLRLVGYQGRTHLLGPPCPSFLKSLGTCLLAGTLDVVLSTVLRPHRRRDSTKRDSKLSLSECWSTGSCTAASAMSMAQTQALTGGEPVKVKYLAAFLYEGGYVILAKAPKAGVYEPRHWFSLADDTVEVIDVDENEGKCIVKFVLSKDTTFLIYEDVISETALLPCSFHLVFHASGHRVELAAACQREKELWLDVINYSRQIAAAWEYEPVSTLSVYTSLASARARSSIEILAVPSVPSTLDDCHSQQFGRTSSAVLRIDTATKPSRRASLTTAGVRSLSFFMNNSSASNEGTNALPATVLIRRASQQRRAQTERYVADVLTERLLAARTHAKAHDKVLFRDPVPPPSGSGLGVGALAKNRLTARDSVLVPKQCGPSIPMATIVNVSGLPPTACQDPMRLVSLSEIITAAKRSTSKNSGSRNSLSRLTTIHAPHVESPSPLIESRQGGMRESKYTSTSSHGPLSPDSSLASTNTSRDSRPHSPEQLPRLSQCSSVATSSAASTSPMTQTSTMLPHVRVLRMDNQIVHDSMSEEPLSADLLLSRPKRTRTFVGSMRGLFGTSRSSADSAKRRKHMTFTSPSAFSIISTSDVALPLVSRSPSASAALSLSRILPQAECSTSYDKSSLSGATALSRSSMVSDTTTALTPGLASDASLDSVRGTPERSARPQRSKSRSIFARLWKARSLRHRSKSTLEGSDTSGALENVTQRDSQHQAAIRQASQSAFCTAENSPVPATTASGFSSVYGPVRQERDAQKVGSLMIGVGARLPRTLSLRLPTGRPEMMNAAGSSLMPPLSPSIPLATNSLSSDANIHNEMVPQNVFPPSPIAVSASVSDSSVQTPVANGRRRLSLLDIPRRKSESLSRSIKYRLLPGSLVSLTPVEAAR